MDVHKQIVTPAKMRSVNDDKAMKTLALQTDPYQPPCALI